LKTDFEKINFVSFNHKKSNQMTVKKISLLMAFATVLFCACKKSTRDTPAPTQPRISKIVYANESVSYTYNNDGTLKENIIRHNAGGEISKLEYIYENGKLKESRGGNGKLVYTYPNPSTVQVEMKGITGITAFSIEFKFDGNRLLEWVEYSHGTGTKQPDQKAVHTYNNAGNIVKSEQFSFDGAAWVRYENIDVQYDNRTNYTSHLDNMPYYLGNNIRILTNNPVKEEYRGIDGAIFKTVTYQHTYDAMGRKTRSLVKTIDHGLPEETETIIFEY
jgi:hypothetical protein